ncbi:alpha/beta hydrolase [Spartinivicinus marinus]|uniref:alpha/beta hydrolase n=1 Tax=Spartinivicinus marinus TaxID=2994442 RepID=UPI001C5CBEA4|nr:alpha/beta hydrolase-fold protein [Spartinivicinus marinus]
MYIKETSVKSVIFIFLAVFSYLANADKAFEIPRSEVIELQEPTIKRVYPLFVKLPRSYNSSADKKYPVIYLMDAWYSFQIVSGATRFPMNRGGMEEAIIVGISYSKGSTDNSSRVRDYTPVKDEGWKRETGNANGYSKFIKEVVFPYIENNYRAAPSRRTFVGNSLGGLLGAYILFNSPDMFDSYIIGSPSVWYKNNYILSQPMKMPRTPVKVYLSVGSLEMPTFGARNDMVAGAKALAIKLNKQLKSRVDLKLSIIKDASHATAFPTTAIQGLDWIYGKK